MDRWNLDRDPLLALREGDGAPFERFVRLHTRTMIAYFRQRGAGLGRAEDLAQEVLLKLHRGAERYRAQERFSSFCFRVARNVWFDDCRRRGVRPEPALGGEELERADPPAPPVDPARGLVRAEEEEGVRQLLASLPPSHREVFELAVLGELGYAEVAEQLDIPVGTVKSRMFYAIRRLRAAWDEHHADGAAHGSDDEEGAR